MFLNLKPKKDRKRSQEDLKKLVRMKLRQIPGMKASAEDLAIVAGGGIRATPIQYSIRGQDLTALQNMPSKLVKSLPGCQALWMWIRRWKPKPEFKVYIDRDRAADLGVDVATVAEAINLLISGELTSPGIRMNCAENAMISVSAFTRKTVTAKGPWNGIYVRARDGKLVELSNVVKIEEGTGPSVINRVDRQRATIFASLER